MLRISRNNISLKINYLKPIIYALVLNQNYWIIGLIPTQVFALPLLRYSFVGIRFHKV